MKERRHHHKTQSSQAACSFALMERKFRRQSSAFFSFTAVLAIDKYEREKFRGAKAIFT